MLTYHTKGATTKKERAAGSTNTLYLATCAGTVPVTVIRKRVKNFNLRVRADGSVCLSMPARATLDAAQQMLGRHVRWVEKRLARAAAAEKGRRGVLEAGFVPLWGQRAEIALRLNETYRHAGARLVKEEGSETAAKPQAVIEMTLPAALDAAAREEAAQALVEKIYRAEILRVLPAIAPTYENALGVQASAWSVRRMKTRWGSCTPKTKRMRLNAQLAAYPPFCLDYVVAHELAHLREPSHNEHFHALVEDCCKHAEQAQKRLRQSPLE